MTEGNGTSSATADGRLAPSRSRVAAGLWRALDNPATIWWAIAAYCIVHLILRLALSPIYSLDEAEQVQFAQSLEWGYRFRHPPLITWMVWATQAVFGLDRLAFFALKYLLMAAGYAFLFLAARRLLKDTRLATLATASYTLIYAMGYLAHIDLMHTIVLTTMLAACLFVAVRAIEERKLTDYAWLGLVIGLGLLSKYLFVFLPVALIVVALAWPALRRRVRWDGVAIAVGIAAVIIAPFAVWVLTHDYSFIDLGRTVTGATTTGPAAWLQGLVGLAEALIMFPMPLLAIFVAVFPASLVALVRKTPETAEHRRLLALTMVFATVALACALLMVDATALRERWLHPVLLPLPIYLFLLLKDAPPSRVRVLGFFWIIIAVAAGAAAMRMVTYTIEADGCRECRQHAPFAALAEQLRGHGFEGGTIYVDNHFVGGNLRAEFPASRVLEAGYPPSIFPDDPRGGQCLLIWRQGDGALPPAMAAGFAPAFGAEIDPNLNGQSLSAPLLTTDNRPYTLHYTLFADGLGRCN